jgi:hypothetical protein
MSCTHQGVCAIPAAPRGALAGFPGVELLHPFITKSAGIIQVISSLVSLVVILPFLNQKFEPMAEILHTIPSIATGELICTSEIASLSEVSSLA